VTARRAGTAGRPLRVAVVTDGCYPYFKGGKEVRFHELLQRLAGPEVRVDVYTMRWWPGPRRRRDGDVTLHGICRAWPMYVGTRRSIRQALLFALACLRLLTVRADVIDADHMPYLPLLPLKVVSVLRGIPLVVTWHEWWGGEYWRSYLGRLGALAAWLERRVAGLGDRVVVATEHTEARLVAGGVRAERIRVLPLGVDVPAIAATAAAPAVYDVVFVGRLIAHKGAHLLIEAIAELARRGCAPTCAIVGEGPERARLEAQAARCGVAGRVHFLGRLEDHHEVWALVKSATVFAHPSLREGFGLAVAEAIACGTQVVTIDHPDNHARHLVIAGVSGRLCRPDVDDLADAVAACLYRPLAAETVRAGADGFGWPERAAELGAIYAAAGST